MRGLRIHHGIKHQGTSFKVRSTVKDDHSNEPSSPEEEEEEIILPRRTIIKPVVTLSFSVNSTLNF